MLFTLFDGKYRNMNNFEEQVVIAVAAAISACVWLVIELLRGDL